MDCPNCQRPGRRGCSLLPLVRATWPGTDPDGTAVLDRRQGGANAGRQPRQRAGGRRPPRRGGAAAVPGLRRRQQHAPGCSAPAAVSTSTRASGPWPRRSSTARARGGRRRGRVAAERHRQPHGRGSSRPSSCSGRSSASPSACCCRAGAARAPSTARRRSTRASTPANRSHWRSPPWGPPRSRPPSGEADVRRQQPRRRQRHHRLEPRPRRGGRRGRRPGAGAVGSRRGSPR